MKNIIIKYIKLLIYFTHLGGCNICLNQNKPSCRFPCYLCVYKKSKVCMGCIAKSNKEKNRCIDK